MTTDQQAKTAYRKRLQRMRADHNFHPTKPLLAKAMKFRVTVKVAAQDNPKPSQDPQARQMAQEMVRHAKHWYTQWLQYRTDLWMPPDEDEIQETAKTPNGQVVQAAKALGWAIQNQKDITQPTRHLLKAALSLRSNRLDNTQPLKSDAPPDTTQNPHSKPTSPIEPPVHPTIPGDQPAS